MYKNLDIVLKSKGCDNRDWYAGGCSAIDEIKKVIRKYQDDFKIKKE